MHKDTLSEIKVITGTVGKESLLKQQLVKNHVFANYSLANKIKDDQYWHLEDYISIPYHQHLQWFEDYIRDHYKLKYNKTLVKIPDVKLGTRSLIQQTGEQVNIPYDLKTSLSWFAFEQTAQNLVQELEITLSDN